MSKLRTFLKNHMLLVGLAAVVVPLLSILALQYRSLLKLEETSIVAGTVGMKNYLGDVSKEVKAFYKTTTDQVLNVPAYTIQGQNLHHVKYHFPKCTVEGAKRIFIASFGPDGSQMIFFDPNGMKKMAEAPEGETNAARRAVALMRLLNQEGTTVKSPMHYYEDRDPENRVIYKPIVDEQ